MFFLCSVTFLKSNLWSQLFCWCIMLLSMLFIFKSLECSSFFFRFCQSIFQSLPIDYFINSCFGYRIHFLLNIFLIDLEAFVTIFMLSWIKFLSRLLVMVFIGNIIYLVFAFSFLILLSLSALFILYTFLFTMCMKGLGSSKFF